MKTIRPLAQFLVLALLPAILHAQFVCTTNADNTITITRYSGNPPGTLVIPAIISGKPVVAIGPLALASNNFSSLVVMPDSITNIWHGAFLNSRFLNNVHISSNSVSIGDQAFEGCPLGGGITIPSTVTNIGIRAFNNCTNLHSITVAALNPFYSSIDGVLFNKNQTTLIQYPGALTGSYILSNSVTSISLFAFSQCAGLTDITIDADVTNIGFGAFQLCTNLTSLYFDGNAPNHDASVFYGDNLATIYYWPDTKNWVTSFGGLPALPMQSGNFSIARNGDGTCTITGYTGPEGDILITNSLRGLLVANIANGAFSNNTNLLNMTIPDSITTIGNDAFANCVALSNIVIGANVASIGNSAFSGSSLTNVFIPANVLSIGTAPFQNCINLKAITVDPSNPNYSSDGGVLFDKNQNTLVEYPGGLAGYYVIPNSVTNIGPYAFSYCPDLWAVSIATNVTHLADWAFANCSQLHSVTFLGPPPDLGGSNVFCGDINTHIAYLPWESGWGSPTFGGQPAMPNIYFSTNNNSIIIEGILDYLARSLDIPATINGLPVTDIIGPYIDAPILSSITIPHSVTNVQGMPFAFCHNLTNVLFLGNAPAHLDPNTFYNDENVTVYYTEGALGWEGVSFNGRPVVLWNPQPYTGDLIYEATNNAITILGCTNWLTVTSITIPPTINGFWVTGIGDFGWSFYYCPKLSSVTIPSSVTNIFDFAFADCNNLSNVYFIGNAPQIDPSAFYGSPVTIYRLPHTSGWDTFTGPTPVLWDPQVRPDATFGMRTNCFGFTITNAGSPTLVVDACTNLSNPIWMPISTNTLTGGSSYFSDPHWTNHPGRFYRFRAP